MLKYKECNLLNNKVIFIIGASGQDGTLMRLALRDAKVICVSRRPLQKSLNAREIIEVVNSYEISNLKNLIEKYKPDVILNFSGLASVAECQQYPEKSLAFNFQIVEKLVEAIKDSKNNNCIFVQCSSSEMFGQGEIICNEDRSMNPVTIYGKHKMQAINYLNSQIGERLLNLILFNHESEYRSEKFVSKKIVNGIRKHIITGEQIKLGDINSARDWSYAPDFIAGMLKLISAEKIGNYVFGSGISHTVKEFALLAMKFQKIDKDFEEVFTVDKNLYRSVETPPLLADSSKYSNEFSRLTKHNFEKMVHTLLFNSSEKALN